MNGRVKSRNGSALLIVLGMLSFMVISAVAFSMFMRENRLPSSFLRQKLVANHLVKAALANAMNEIDAAIASNSYPGASDDAVPREINGKDPEQLHNKWQHRVFTGTTTSSDTDDIDEATVPTLTLEALAYLPPPLINTVRYMSRRTPTARWNQLKYDAGRYAYTAVNVSDYLDINRLRANVMRDSSPSNRVSLAYLFDDSSKAKDFDAFIKKVREDTKYNSRLVSLADYNLAIGFSSDGDVGFKSPFLEYFSGGGDGTFYTDVTSDMAKRQQFVTDSWYPAVATNGVIYLSDYSDQEFCSIDPGLYSIGSDKSGGTIYDRLKKRMDLATFAALCDYVDEDDVPTSLAVPTLEHTPMLTGLALSQAPNGISILLESDTKPVSEGTEENPGKINRRTWTIKSVFAKPLHYKAHGVYPFKRSSSPNEASSYDVQLLVKAFFSSSDLDLEASTRLPESFLSSLKPMDLKEWKTQVLKDGETPYMWTVLEKTTAKVRANRKKAEDCEVTIDDGEIEFKNSDFEGLGVFGIRYKENDPQGTASYDATEIKNPLIYFGADGSRKRITDVVKGGVPNVSLRLNFVVYARILSDYDKTKTVDLVPAICGDDEIYNKAEYRSFSADSNIAHSICGSGEPVLPIATSALINVNVGAFAENIDADNPGSPGDVTCGSLMICCDDPRFNFAPEDWYTVDSIDWSKWFENAKARCNGQDGRQNDIFQFVSDCGYLQSMGELQFLPFLALAPKDDKFCGFYPYTSGGDYKQFETEYYKKPEKYNGGPFSERDAPGKTANHEFAWRTHWAFGKYADWAYPQKDTTRNPYNWGILDARDGVVVNPYSSSDELLMAGLVNTPYDWTVAGLAADGDFTAGDVDKFTFNSKSSEAKLGDEDVKEIASSLRDCLTDGLGWDKDLGGSAEWNDEWNDMWDTAGEILGTQVADIHDVDRKFLYSYWKGCFGNRQQLFLIFVRAEPTSMGAGIASHTPAQLGARAVALVWREPISSIESSDDDKPHRMRILFYHQFE